MMKYIRLFENSYAIKYNYYIKITDESFLNMNLNPIVKIIGKKGKPPYVYFKIEGIDSNNYIVILDNIPCILNHRKANRNEIDEYELKKQAIIYNL